MLIQKAPDTLVVDALPARVREEKLPRECVGLADEVRKPLVSRRNECVADAGVLH